MPALPGKHYERMLDLAVAVLEADEPERIWSLVAQELLSAVDGSLVIAKDEDWTTSSGALAVWERDSPRPPALDEHTVRRIRAGYPFAGHYGTGTDRAPRSAAHIAGSRTWHHSPTASALRRTLGTRHMLGVPFPAPDDPVRGLVVHRTTRDFTERQRQYAERVQPLLAAAATQRALLGRCRADAAAHRPDPVARAVSGGLTPRETAVLRLLAEGLPAAALARRLGVSVRTVHKHLQNLYRKLDTADRLGAVLRAQELGLIAGPAPERAPGERRPG